MSDLLDRYLNYLYEYTPAMSLMPAKRPVGYKGVVSSIGGYDEEDEEEYKRQHAMRRFAGKGRVPVKKEYTSYNPDGSSYGMTLQRWNPAGSGVSEPAKNLSQKIVKKDIEVKIKDEKKGGKQKTKK